jgi:hypothetical protein
MYSPPHCRYLVLSRPMKFFHQGSENHIKQRKSTTLLSKMYFRIYDILYLLAFTIYYKLRLFQLQFSYTNVIKLHIQSINEKQRKQVGPCKFWYNFKHVCMKSMWSKLWNTISRIRFCFTSIYNQHLTKKYKSFSLN